MRTLALLLVLINVCFLFWSQYIDVPDQATTAATTPANASARRLMLATERYTPLPIDHGGVSTLPTCVSIGPFAEGSDFNDIQERLHSAGFGVTPRIEHGEVFAGYWVSLPSVSKRQDAEQTLTRLHTGGISDAYLLSDDTPPNVISLGLFSEQSHAERRRDEVFKLGLQAQIQPRTHAGEQHWLNINLQEPGQAIDPALLQPQTGAIVRLETKPCPKSVDAKG